MSRTSETLVLSDANKREIDFEISNAACGFFIAQIDANQFVVIDDLFLPVSYVTISQVLEIKENLADTYDTVLSIYYVSQGKVNEVAYEILQQVFSGNKLNFISDFGATSHLRITDEYGLEFLSNDESVFSQVILQRENMVPESYKVLSFKEYMYEVYGIRQPTQIELYGKINEDFLFSYMKSYLNLELDASAFDTLSNFLFGLSEYNVPALRVAIQLLPTLFSPDILIQILAVDEVERDDDSFGNTLLLKLAQLYNQSFEPQKEIIVACMELLFNLDKKVVSAILMDLNAQSSNFLIILIESFPRDANFPHPLWELVFATLINNLTHKETNILLNEKDDIHMSFKTYVEKYMSEEGLDYFTTKIDALTKPKVEPSLPIDSLGAAPMELEKKAIYSISGYGFNCGLHALALGIAEGLREMTEPSAASFPFIFHEITRDSVSSLNSDCEYLKELGEKLRAMLTNSFCDNEAYKQRRMENFIQVCLAKFNKDRTAADMEAFLESNSELIEFITGSLEDFFMQAKAADTIFTISMLGEGVDADEEDSSQEDSSMIAMQRLFSSRKRKRSDEAILIEAPAVKARKRLIDMDYSDGLSFNEAIAQELRSVLNTVNPSEALSSYLLDHRPTLQELSLDIGLSQLTIYYAVFVQELEQVVPEMREALNSTMRKWLLENLFLYMDQCSDEVAKNSALCKIGHFIAEANIPGYSSDTDNYISNALEFFSAYLVHKNWEQVFDNYCHYLETTQTMISADELAILAMSHNVELKVIFAQGETTVYSSGDEQNYMTVVLSNPTGVHWEFDETIKIEDRLKKVSWPVL